MLDFRIYQDCFSTPEMRDIWSEQATISAWLDVEQALARCQADVGVISKAAASAIEAIRLDDIDHRELIAEMALVGRPIVGLVKQLRLLVGVHGGEVHFNSTTQDIMDTAMVLQIKQGLELISASCEALVRRFDELAEENTGTIMIGRTNGQHAVPMLLATKFGVWQSELSRRLEAVEQAQSRGLNVQLGGPVGDLRGYEKSRGMRVKAAMAEKFGIGIVEPHWQNARDGIADIISSLGALCASLCKIARNVNLLSSSDIAEFSEVHVAGKGASSAMHHKRNQRGSEFMEAVARLGRQRAEQVGEMTLHEHERSGGAWIGEWVVVPEVFLLTSGAVKWANLLFDNIGINTEKMAERCKIEQFA